MERCLSIRKFGILDFLADTNQPIVGTLFGMLVASLLLLASRYATSSSND
jgi:hypothetical protein